MNKGILIILAMSIIVFGAIMWMAGSGTAAPSSGTINVVLNSANAKGGESAPAPAQAAPALQVVSVRALNSGAYDHPTLQVKDGEPVELHFSADPNVGCGAQFILDGFNVNLVSRGEDEVARFTPTQPGTYAYHCGMN
ncbi:MAG: cupredoxin domain-containing protein, partial [Candidatus Micrarchaeota archaeon]|nr:cupredoxin domain-containing protein [Candidatus Micrarchaeota archaeon]